MMTGAPPREFEERLRDTRARLENDVDLWVATSGPGGVHLIPLSHLWDGTAFLISTPRASVTSRNLLADGRVRLGLGPTRDVVLVDGTAEPVDIDSLGPEAGDAFAKKTGFDPLAGAKARVIATATTADAGVLRDLGADGTIG